MNRSTYILKRLALGVPVILFGLTVTFIVLFLSPLDPARAVLGRDATPAAVRQLEIAWGIRYPNGERVPLWIQYKNFILDMLTFKFGNSWAIAREQSVMSLIIGRLPATLWLGFWSVVVALGIGIPVGLYAGLNANTYRDYFSSFGGIIWRAMPNFWLAVMLSSILSAGGILSWYRGFLIPTDVIGTPDALGHLFTGTTLFAGIPILELLWIPIPNFHNLALAFKWVLPAALVLGSSSMGNEIRIGRTAVLESINAKYIETAKAKGVSTRTIITKHIGRNAILPLLPVVMGEFYLLIGGSVLVEKVFSINGVGSLFLRAALDADVPVVMSLTYLFILILVLFNITQDLLYTYIDPRIELQDNNG